MKFRFTLTHPGSEVAQIALPAFSDWETQVGAGEEWTEGAVPMVNLVDTYPAATSDSEYLVIDYAFEIGNEYTLTLEYEVVFNVVDNVADVILAVLDGANTVIFSESESFSDTQSGSVTLSFTADASCTRIGIKGSMLNLILGDGDLDLSLISISGTTIDPADITESIEINEPDGWKEAVMKLARDKEFYSLVELFDGSFIFYGDNGQVNGGLAFIEYYEITRGLDASIEILIEIAPDDETYETCFEGQLDLSLGERLPKNKYRIPIIRDNFWAKFNSRYKTPVDLQAGVDLDGGPVELVEPVNIILTDQKVTYFSDYNWLYTMTYPAESDPALTYMILSYEEEIRADIKLFSLARQATDTEGAKIFGLFEAPWNGDYRVQIRVICARYDAPDWDGLTTNRLRIRKTNEDSFTVYQFTGGITDGSDNAIIIDVDETYHLNRGEQLSIMLHRASSGTPVTVFGRQQLTWLEVDLATTTTTDLTGEETIDGTLTSSSRVLVKNQGNPQENGIYVTGAGAWTRATDMDTADEFENVAVFVSGGTDQTDTAWRQTEPVNIVGIDAVRFVFSEPSDEWQKPFNAVYDTDNYSLGTGADDQPDSDVFTERTTPGSFIKITATTVYPSTEAPGFLIHDAGAAALKSYGLGGDSPFYSELLGSTLTNARTYEQDGCAWRYFVTRGLQIRGYTLAEKPFSMSFEQWWKGINPILCLGLEYQTIPGETINPEALAIQDLDEWDDAGGSFPGTWNYATYLLPFVSVNGSGGVEGYTCGLWAAEAGVTYVITTVVEIFEGGSNPTDITFIWAALDAGYNELVTEQFTYNSKGFHTETFNITPPSDATYFAVRIINDTFSDTQTLAIRLAIGETAEQLLANEEFSSSSDWTNEGAGTAWAIGGGVATVSLTSTFTASQALTQLIDTDLVGQYYFISEYRPSGVSGGDEITMSIIAYDEDDNVLAVKHEPTTDNTTRPWYHSFTTIVPVAKVEIFMTMSAGTNASVELPYAALFVVSPTEPIVTVDEQVIRVEEREFFYQEEMSVLISNIEEISRKYDPEKIYNKIEIGYSQWQSEDISGIDDPQAKHIYSDRFQKVGQEIIVLSDFIAASLAIETTRRQAIEKSTDYKFDNNTFIIAINPDDVSPDSYVPELDENFTSIENLLNSATRYNVRLAVERNFLRWRKWFNGCLQSYLSSFYRFVSGEGNFDMISTIDQSPDCLGEDNEGQPLSGKQAIEVTEEIIHTPFYYEFEVPMEWETYKTIRENRRNAIGISLTDSDHVPLFIDQLDYQVMEGKAKVTGWTKEYLSLDIVEGGAATQECMPSTECDNPITDEDGENITTETGVCITA